ncbi:SMC-Scp complex subunit ScpB [Paenisporosarcina cavernae]|uniref:Segregation and condensation protein B n=1 Tax=Paenisporosarcina cavernae TaxID=2320858 RepID=A0A385YYP1_9BACL|nr:SMC-Scp complex subunit ScpB [Paenisporosarcina cavernae]AYC30778.1 SMC-Scp complex subunit ScpB [Paenisporosarcina cavernae]
MSKMESLLFVAGDDGLTAKQLAVLIDCSTKEVEEILRNMQETYVTRVESGIELKELAGTFQLISKISNSDIVQKLVDNPTNQSLSQAALEVLAIVAYKQPITRVEIENLRGVKCERPLQTLSSKGLLQEVGRAEGTGRAILYGTTKEFLHLFGLNQLEELPPLLEQEDETDQLEQTDLFLTKFQEAFHDQEEK